MEPPKPKTPMIARVSGDPAYRYILITTFSSDAHVWVLENLARYGNLNESSMNCHIMRYGLTVAEVFDLQEVVDYINSMADSFR